MSDTIRTHVHGMWAAVADQWAEYADHVERRTPHLNATLIDAAGLTRADNVLELACGPGGLGIEAAPNVASLVLSDVVPAMTDIAGKRAAAAGLSNVTTEVLDLEDLAVGDATFDAVLCREGLMFAVDPAAAFAEIHRVLRPGGRLAASVWGERVANPWLGAVLDAVSAQLGRELPPPGLPGPFSLSDPDRLAALARGAGFADVHVTELPVPLRAASFDEWWTRTCGLAGPIAGIVAALDDTGRAELAARARALVEPYITSDGLEFPGLVLVLRTRR